MTRQGRGLSVARAQVEAALGELRRVWYCNAIDPADVALFARVLPEGADFVLVRAGSHWVGFSTGKPGVGFPAKALSNAEASRAILVQLQGREPSAVRTSAGWAVLVRPPRIAVVWEPGDRTLTT